MKNSYFYNHSLVYDANTEKGKLNFKAFPRIKRRLELCKKYCSGSILEVGCSNGLLLDYLKHKRHLGIEPSKKAVREGKKRGLNIHMGSIYFLNRLHKIFNVIYCLGVFPHISNLGSALDQLKLVMDKESILIIYENNCYSYHRILFPIHYPKHDQHIVTFDEVHMDNLLEAYNFKIIKKYYIPNRGISKIMTWINKKYCDGLFYVIKKN